MFTPFHILCNSNRITLRQTVICGIPSFQFEDFLFALYPSYEKKMFLYSRLPGGLIPEALQVFEQTSVKGQIKQSRAGPGDAGTREHQRHNNMPKNPLMSLAFKPRANLIFHKRQNIEIYQMCDSVHIFFN